LSYFAAMWSLGLFKTFADIDLYGVREDSKI